MENYLVGCQVIGEVNDWIEAEVTPSMLVSDQDAEAKSAWKAKYMDFHLESEQALLDDYGKAAFDYLVALGFTEKTIKKYRLGFHACDEHAMRMANHNNQLNAAETVTSVFQDNLMPSGIVVPCFSGSELQSLKIRRIGTMSEKDEPYFKITGSQPAIFGVENFLHPHAIFFEDEFDAMLVDQIAGDLIGVAALGCAGEHFSDLDLSIWGKYLLPIYKMYVVCTNDSNGKVRARKLQTFSDRIIPLPFPETPGCNNLSEYWQAGGNIRHWIRQALNNQVENLTTKRTASPTCTISIDLGEKTKRYLDQPFSVDPSIPCFCCGNSNYRKCTDTDSYVCATCHPFA